MSKCPRCSYIWLAAGHREVPKTGNLYMLDLGLCRKCGNHTSRVRVATPGEQVEACAIFGPRFERIVRREL